MSRRDRTIALVKLEPEPLADTIAAAVGGRARAIELLEQAVAYLRGQR